MQGNIQSHNLRFLRNRTSVILCNCWLRRFEHQLLTLRVYVKLEFLRLKNMAF